MYTSHRDNPVYDACVPWDHIFHYIATPAAVSLDTEQAIDTAWHSGLI